MTFIEPGPKFAELFETFEHTTFRLETRDHYNSPIEAESYRKFLAGERDPPFHADWLAMVRQATAEGRRFARVRVVSFPFTDYTRFGLWLSEYTCEAGEDIRYLIREQAADLPKYDYWLFDSRKLLMMRFAADDRFIGGELVDDPAELIRHNHWHDVAQHHAIKRDEFIARYE